MSTHEYMSTATIAMASTIVVIRMAASAEAVESVQKTRSAHLLLDPLFTYRTLYEIQLFDERENWANEGNENHIFPASASIAMTYESIAIRCRSLELLDRPSAASVVNLWGGFRLPLVAYRRFSELFATGCTKWHTVRPFKNLEVSIWKSRFLFTWKPSRKFNRRIIFDRRILLRIQMVACRVLSIQLLAAQPLHSCYNLLWFEIDLISRSSFWTRPMLIAVHLSLFIFVHLPLFIPLAIHLPPLSLVCHSC